MTFADRCLEKRIELQGKTLNFAMQCGGAEAATRELDKLKALIAQRSPEQIAHMEAKMRGGSDA